MKKLSILLFVSFCFTMAFGQQNPFAPVQSKWEVVGTNVELNYHNSDYCDYYLVSSRNKELWVQMGKNNLVSVEKKYASKYRNDPDFMQSSFRSYKGYFPEKINKYFLYSLPVKTGDSIKYAIDKNKKVLTHLFETEALDTIYAIRGGGVCKKQNQGWNKRQGNLEDGTSLLVYHLDRSFVLYGNLSKIFVREGEKISVGQAIGLADSNGKITTSFFFLDKNKFENGRPEGLAHSYFNPIFQTANAGGVALEEGKMYVAELSDEVVTQDMSKRAKSKYEKKKSKK